MQAICPKCKTVPNVNLGGHFDFVSYPKGFYVNCRTCGRFQFTAYPEISQAIEAWNSGEDVWIFGEDLP